MYDFVNTRIKSKYVIHLLVLLLAHRFFLTGFCFFFLFLSDQMLVELSAHISILFHFASVLTEAHFYQIIES